MKFEHDPEIELLMPDLDEVEPELSIVVPALNEELTIKEFVQWCKEGLKNADTKGEILIVDSSTDRTAEIALAEGARVLKTPRRGLGRAYIDAIRFIRGPYVLMGDCDCTYDFREIAPFLKKFKEGSEFIMGSRLQGYIESDAMPSLHRYFGTPLTTWILNFIYKSKFSDIHCGMRGITLEALTKLKLQSQSWEYASEMILKSIHHNLRIAEVPIRFLNNRHGRVSQHKRLGWFSPWQAGWINLKAMFIYGADFFLFKPGLFFLLLGLALVIPVGLAGPIKLGPITFSLYWMLLGICLVIIGLQSFFVSLIATIIYDYSGTNSYRLVLIFPYTRTSLISLSFCLIGMALCIPLLWHYFNTGLSFPELNDDFYYLALLGLLSIISGFITFTSMLVLHSLVLTLNRA